MIKLKEFKTLEEGMVLLEEKSKSAPISIEEILHILSGKGRSLLLILLSLPFCQPIQIPGLSIPFGLVIAFIGIRLVFGKGIWLPKKILSKKISSKTLEKLTSKTLIIVKKVRSWTRPRLIWMCHSPFMEKANGILIFLLGLFLALPIAIPLSNLTVAWSIFLISFGILEDDGLFVLVSYLLSIATAIFFILMGATIKNLVSHWL